MIVGILELALGALITVPNILQIAGLTGGSPEFESGLERVFLRVIFAAYALSIPLGSLIIFGALRMRRGKNRKLAMAAAILALLPVSPCFPVGVIFGTWSLMVLTSTEAEFYFTEKSK
jgi:hypothetical protein